MAWWIWVIAGVACLTAELTLISADFYLLFVGVAAVVTGLVAALWPDSPTWLPWVGFIVLTVIGVGYFRRRLSARLGVAGLAPPGLSPLGSQLVLPRDLEPGAEDRLEFRGASWAVRNGSDVILMTGQTATVRAVDGLTLILAPQHPG